MERSIKDHIVDALDNLLEKELKRFRDVLSSQTINGVKIARGKVEHADSIDLANLIISHHTEGKAVEVTVMVLKNIGQNQEAAELECKAGRNAQGTQFGQQVQSSEGPANFLEKHREALIQRVTMVPPILDSLLSKKLIDNECYDEVLSETTNQRKMRRLYAMVSAWGNKEKLEFFNTLKEKQPYLIEDLMGK